MVSVKYTLSNRTYREYEERRKYLLTNVDFQRIPLIHIHKMHKGQ